MWMCMHQAIGESLLFATPKLIHELRKKEPVRYMAFKVFTCRSDSLHFTWTDLQLIPCHGRPSLPQRLSSFIFTNKQCHRHRLTNPLLQCATGRGLKSQRADSHATPAYAAQGVLFFQGAMSDGRLESPDGPEHVGRLLFHQLVHFGISQFLVELFFFLFLQVGPVEDSRFHLWRLFLWLFFERFTLFLFFFFFIFSMATS
mmetsp:Transcript_13369/g.23463  ORF Transcript_13369/g.23463 Transcript_13369/m.23463 type:complete len:201 (-) Transcript_13369:547-1149(-)